uniref:Uncharacterized protein n=1 Tax=Nymphaea colorata TaxID=210225 RepID=A0A5K1EYM0_9MAGN|nr:unnamed protein product [Nymphaea colorata]
MDSFGEMAG